MKTPMVFSFYCYCGNQITKSNLHTFVIFATPPRHIDFTGNTDEIARTRIIIVYFWYACISDFILTSNANMVFYFVLLFPVIAKYIIDHKTFMFYRFRLHYKHFMCVVYFSWGLFQ